MMFQPCFLAVETKGEPRSDGGGFAAVAFLLTAFAFVITPPFDVRFVRQYQWLSLDVTRRQDYKL
jgi:hypothetical protein